MLVKFVKEVPGRWVVGDVICMSVTSAEKWIASGHAEKAK